MSPGAVSGLNRSNHSFLWVGGWASDPAELLLCQLSRNEHSARFSGRSAVGTRAGVRSGIGRFLERESG